MARKSAKAEPQEIPAPIIVKKVTVVEGGHHGGAWKVAYADFVTAMMAFFLLMWLLGATDENQRQGLADYFAPTLVKMKEKTVGADGLMNGSSLTDVDNYPNRQGQTGSRSTTIPRDAKGGAKEAERRNEKAQEMREQIKKLQEGDSKLGELAKFVQIKTAPDGVRVDLVDDAKFSMFALGTTILTPDAEKLVRAIAAVVNGQEGTLSVRGHTDALPWKDNSQANNWSLSAGRAESTRQELIRDGVDSARFRKIEGVADQELLLPDNPQDPRNRRISILVGD